MRTVSRRNHRAGSGYAARVPTPARSAWYQTINAMTALVELMDRELNEDCGIPLAWYDVMIEVYRSPGHSIRMSELADRVLLSRSWITRRVRQLEDAGLLTRTTAPDDQRGVIASLTPAGLDAFRELERSHAASIGRHFASHLSHEDAELITQRFAVIATHARGALAQSARHG
jgi:DNA-binding MarR family transcriptional regulator